MSEDQIERLQIDLTQLVGEVVTVDAVQQHTVSSADLTVCRMRYRISDIGYRISDIGYRISDIERRLKPANSTNRCRISCRRLRRAGVSPQSSHEGFGWQTLFFAGEYG